MFVSDVDLADVLRRAGHLERAVSLARETIALFPRDADVRSKLSAIAEAKTRHSPSSEEEPGKVSNVGTGIGSGRTKVRIYDLAKELKLQSKRLIEELRREGVDVSVPSNVISKELAEKIRSKYYPNKEPVVQRNIRVVKRAKDSSEGTLSALEELKHPSRARVRSSREIIEIIDDKANPIFGELQNSEVDSERFRTVLDRAASELPPTDRTVFILATVEVTLIKR